MFLRAVAICAAVMSVCLPSVLFAQDFPKQTVKLVVPREPGGGNDLLTRQLAAKLTEQYKQQFIVENRPGVSITVGARHVSEQPADGYTWLEAADPTVSAFLDPVQAEFDLLKDITPISKVGFTPYVLVVNAGIAANDPKELMAFAKEHPGDFRWGVGGLGTTVHLAIERINKAADIKVTIVPYKGTGAVVTALLANEITATFVPFSTVKGLVDDKKFKVLGLASLEPMNDYPGIPTVASFGFPSFEAGTWYGFWGSKGWSPELTNTVYDMITKALAEPDLAKQFSDIGIVVSISESPADFADYIKSQLELNGTLIKELNIQPQ